MDEAHRVIEALLDVADHHDGRLPELISGLARDEHAVPAPYPTSCIPQAWSAAAPLLFLRILLGLDVDVPGERVLLEPRLPSSIRRLDVERLWAGPGRLDVTSDGARSVSTASDALAPLLRTGLDQG